MFNLFKKKKAKLPKETLDIPKENQENTIDFIFGIELIPDEYRGLKVWVKQWFNSNGDYIRKGEELCRLNIENERYIILYATTDGYLEIFKQIPTDNNESFLVDKERIFSIHKEINQQKAAELRGKHFENVPLIITDDFLGTKIIKWEVVAGRRNEELLFKGIFDSFLFFAKNDNLDILFFTINNINCKDYAVFKYPTKKYKLTVGSIISLLFDNGEIIKLKILTKPYKYSDVSDWGHIFEVKVPLTTKELEILQYHDLLQWQIEFTNLGKKIAGSLDKNQQYAVKKLSNDYFSLVQRNISNYQPLIDKDDISQVETFDNEVCYVYLMIDLKNNYHKIGISNKPQYREKTLQSEKPTIELVCSKRFPNRKIAASFEQALHQTYGDKRIRGEWFDLNDKEAQELKESLT